MVARRCHATAEKFLMPATITRVNSVALWETASRAHSDPRSAAPNA